MLVTAADAPLHNEFEAPAPAPAPVPAAVETSAESEGPRGLARYRNAAMVGAGGLACAAVGAFLGGLGGAFTISPAAAHPLASATSPDESAAAAEQAADGAGSTSGTAALTTAALSSLSGSLTQSAAPLQWLTSQTGSLPATLADLSSAGTSAGSGSGAGDGSGLGSGLGTGIGCTPTTTDLGLGCVLGGLTTALGNVGTLPSDPTETLGSLAPTLTGVVTNLTGTLADLGSLIPLASLPLPAGGIPSLGLPGLSALDSVLPATAGTPSSLLSGTGGIAALLDGVTAAASGATGAHRLDLAHAPVAPPRRERELRAGAAEACRACPDRAEPARHGLGRRQRRRPRPRAARAARRPAAPRRRRAPPPRRR